MKNTYYNLTNNTHKTKRDMNTLQVTQQKPADKLWIDEQGQEIPYARTTNYERKAEVGIGKLAKEAIALNGKLAAFKAMVMETVENLHREFLSTNSAPKTKGKGNITLYNFDRSIKVEVNVNEPIRFDEEYIKLAKAELFGILDDELEGASSWIKGLITDAFEKSRGELDTDKVLSLKKHASRVPANIKDRYDRAMNFIDKAINRPTSKTYHRVWVRSSTGKYENIQLNFSAI